MSASCRMCLVEVEGRRKLEPACSTVVADGMVVNTHSEKVVNTREDMLEILLANHPLDCPVCDKGGECELQDTVFEYGRGDSRLSDPKRVFRSRDIELNKVIIFNANRCIQCQRCVRVCEEIVGDVALGTAERGLDSEITGVGDSLSDCSHCGNCIEVCPVGALMSTPYRYTARPWDLVRTETTCNMCGTGCSMTIETRDGELMRVKSKYETGLNGELLCTKGRFGFDSITGGERIERPMIRRDGNFEPVSWDEASHFIANKIKEITDKGGRISGQISPRQSNETAFLFQKMMRTHFKSDAIYASTRHGGLISGDKLTMKALAQIMGELYSREPLQTILRCDCIIVLGANITDENPVSGYLIRERMRDHDTQLFVASSRPCGLDDIASASLRLRPGLEAHLLSALTTVKPSSGDTVIDFAASCDAVFSSAESVSLLIGTEFMRTEAAKDCLQQIKNAVGIMESAGKKVSVQFLFDRPNQLGIWDMGCLPNFTAGWQGIDTSPDQSNEPSDLHYIVGADLQDLALSETRCLIVQDSHMSTTAERATLLLPSPSYGEENGTYTNNEGRVQLVRSLKAPPSYVMGNAEIFGLIASAMGKVLSPISVENIFDEIRKEVVSYQDLKNWSEENDLGLTSTVDISTPDGKIDSLKEPESLSGYYLITGDDLFQSGLLSSRSEILTSLGDVAYVEMNPGDDFPECETGYQVTIKGEGTHFTAPMKVNKDFADGLIFVPEITLNDLDNKQDSTSSYPCRISVEIKEK